MTAPGDTLDDILDRIADYLPDECASLNHNDLPETKQQFQAYVTKQAEEARIDELQQLKDYAMNDPNYLVPLSVLIDRIKQLRKAK